ncbi:MFS transporter [Streptomyces sp. NPDC049627]|uniref:MFS transporter n=1 Tax=Streptomyces sp. NPDC049627 TaxID=3365595 RepID=UPI003789B9B6
MTDHEPRQGTSAIALLAFACGVAVGNVYFPQAIGPLVTSGLGVASDAAATVITATQFGYAAGIFLLVPLGDRLRPRRLLVTLLTLTGLGLLAASTAQSLLPLVAASALVGAATVIAPLAGPLAAGLVPAERRGVVGGTLLSGCLAGMLLSRAVGGALGEWLGWRAPYVVAGALSLAVAALLARMLPPLPPAAVPPCPPYPALLAAPLRLLRTEPELRRSCLYQATAFAGFCAVWTAVALLLTGPAYGMSARAAGLLALVNAATMVCTPLAGRLVDRRGPDPVNLVCFLVVGVSAAVLAFGGLGGAPGLAALVVGTALLDVGMQSGMVANQVRIYGLGTDVRSRLNTAYMTCVYLGGTAGSWLGARAYGRFGWTGVCVLVAALTAAPLTRHLLRRAAPLPAPASSRPAGWSPSSPPARAR